MHRLCRESTNARNGRRTPTGHSRSNQRWYHPAHTPQTCQVGLLVPADAFAHWLPAVRLFRWICLHNAISSNGRKGSVHAQVGMPSSKGVLCATAVQAARTGAIPSGRSDVAQRQSGPCRLGKTCFGTTCRYAWCCVWTHSSNSDATWGTRGRACLSQPKRPHRSVQHAPKCRASQCFADLLRTGPESGPPMLRPARAGECFSRCVHN